MTLPSTVLPSLGRKVVSTMFWPLPQWQFIRYGQQQRKKLWLPCFPTIAEFCNQKRPLEVFWTPLPKAEPQLTYSLPLCLTYNGSNNICLMNEWACTDRSLSLERRLHGLFMVIGRWQGMCFRVRKIWVQVLALSLTKYAARFFFVRSQMGIILNLWCEAWMRQCIWRILP